MLRFRSLLRRLTLVVVLALAVAALDGCTHGVEDSTSGDSPSPSEEPEAEAPLKVVTRVTRIAGTLPEKQREELTQRTRHIVRVYVRTALVDREPDPGFFGFTPGARRLAARDRDVLTLRELPNDAEVAPERVAAYVAALAPHRRVVGGTVRLEVDLAVTEGGTTRPVHLSGRLLLTPSPKGVRVFGYDLHRSGKALS